MRPKFKHIENQGMVVWDDANSEWVAWDGDITIAGNMIDKDYDYIAVTYPTSSSEVYTFKTGGSGGTTVATVTVTYADSTKEDLSTVEKT